MRIALFSDIYKPQVNGVTNHVELLKRHLESWGHAVYLFVPGAAGYVQDERNVIRIPGLPIADTGYHLSVRLNRAARELLPGMDIVHVHQPFISGSFGLYCASQYKLPLVFTNHTRYDLYVKAYLPLLPAALTDSALQAYFHLFSRHCAALIAPSPSIAQVMKHWRVEGRIVVIPNGIDLARFYAVRPTVTRQQLGIAPDAVVAVYVGRMSPEKSLERLLRIFRHVAVDPQRGPTPVHLLMVGDGSELAELRRLACNLSIAGQVTFGGAVAYADVPSYLALGDLFVSTSVTEVHPLTLIEAAAAGLPALGIHSPGITDIIRDEETGLVAPDRDADFVQRFLRLIQDTELRQKLGAHARCSSREYAAETNARRILALYTELCDAPSPLMRRMHPTSGK